MGKEGVERAREAFHLIISQIGTPNEIPWDFALLRSCFGARGEAHIDFLKELVRNPS